MTQLAFSTNMSKQRSIVRFLLSLLLLSATLLLVGGCRESGPGSKVFLRKDTGQKIRVAVLPFASPGHAPDAGSILTSTVLTYLLSTGAFEVVEPGAVEVAVRAARYIPESMEGLDRDTLDILQKQLHVDAYVVGRVEEFGEVRIGPDSYPSVSFSTRLIRASDASILWAASISRTGADKIKFFDIGRVSSMGKLAKAAVAEMADSMCKASPTLLAALTAPQEATPAASTTSAATNNTTPPASAAFNDESKTYTAADIKTLLPEIQGFTRGEVNHSKHFHDTITATYNGDGTSIDVKLVDYLKAQTAMTFVSQRSAGLEEGKLEGLTAFAGSSSMPTFGYFHVNVALGRFGLYLSGPEAKKDTLRSFTSAIIKGMS